MPRATPLLLRCAAAAALCLGAAAAAAQDRPQPIAAVTADADGDGMPDRVGERVTVGGRVTVAPGALGRAGASTYLQDPSGGVRLRTTPLGSATLGDSLVVHGTLGFRDGTAYLADGVAQRITRRPEHRRLPAPRLVGSADLEALEGRLVTAEGTVAGLSTVEAGQALMLSMPDHSLLVAFVFNGRPEPLDLSGFEPGDRVRVTGVAGQFDRVAPYDESYQVYPRTADDVERVGMSTAVVRRLAALAAVLLLLAGGWVLLLRRQVRRRVAALRHSEERFRRVVAHASDAVYVHDLDGRGLDVNPAARAVFGLADGAAAPDLLAVLAPGQEREAAAFLASLADVGAARTDFVVLSRLGGEAPFEFVAQAFDDADGARHVISLARDVRAQRAYEFGLEEARREAEELVRLKSAFLASMSHEIRTPLTAVIGYADLLADEVDDDTRELVHVIEKGGRRLLSTLNSVLDLARLDSGREPMALQALDLAAHVRDSAALFAPLAEQRGLGFGVDVPPYPVVAAVDVGAFDRVVANLLGNALKFTERGRVGIRVLAEADEAVVHVHDTGIGIAAEFLPELFQEFRQESEGERRSHEGSGLGLAITQRLVAMMRGRVSVESEKGVGTTFSVRLPLARTGDGAAREPLLAGVAE